MLLFIDGFDHYSTKTGAGPTYFTDTLRKKYTDGLYSFVTPTVGHTGSIAQTQSCYIGEEVTNPTLTATLGFGRSLAGFSSPRNSYVVGYWCYLSDSDPVFSSAGASFRTTGRSMGAGIMADGSINIYRTSFGNVYNPSTHPEWTLASSASGTVPYNEWFHFEIKIIYANAGIISVRINGVEVMSHFDDYTGSSDELSSVWVSPGYGQVDDFYLLDTLGDVNNDFLGPCRIHTIYPNRTGYHADATPLGSYLHWQNVAKDFRTAAQLPPLSGGLEITAPGQAMSFGYMRYPFGPSSIFGVQMNAARLNPIAYDVESYGIVRLAGVTTQYPDVLYQPPGEAAITYNTGVFNTTPSGDMWDPYTVNTAEYGIIVSAYTVEISGYALQYTHCPIEIISTSDEPMLNAPTGRWMRAS